MGLGLITLAFLVSFSIIYLAKGLEKKPEQLDKAAGWLSARIEMLAFWGLIYSVIAAILSPIAVWSNVLRIFVFLSNVALFALTLPYMVDHIENKYADKVPASVTAELKKLAALVEKHQKNAGYAGAALSFLLFILLFR
jgi:hypothetical protein